MGIVTGCKDRGVRLFVLRRLGLQGLGAFRELAIHLHVSTRIVRAVVECFCLREDDENMRKQWDVSDKLVDEDPDA